MTAPNARVSGQRDRVLPPKEGLRLARLLMVLSSFSPLFVLWGVRGSTFVPDALFLPFCATMVVGPNALLWLRYRVALANNDKRELTVGTATDHRDHILVYLFAMLLPFYAEDAGTLRDMGSTLAALAFVIFLFWHLNLHYMNLLFAVLHYRVFTIARSEEAGVLQGNSSVALITKRTALPQGTRVEALRLSDTVYLEVSS